MTTRAELVELAVRRTLRRSSRFPVVLKQSVLGQTNIEAVPTANFVFEVLAEWRKLMRLYYPVRKLFGRVEYRRADFVIDA